MNEPKPMTLPALDRGWLKRSIAAVERDIQELPTWLRKPMTNEKLPALDRLAERLENVYAFECEGGPLKNCTDWQQLRAGLTDLRAAFETLEKERDEAREQFDRHVVWASGQAEQAAASLAATKQKLEESYAAGSEARGNNLALLRKLDTAEVLALREANKVDLLRDQIAQLSEAAGVKGLPDQTLPEACEQILSMRASLAAYEAHWQRLGEILKTGGMADPAFLIGQVEAEVSTRAAHEAAIRQLTGILESVDSASLQTSADGLTRLVTWARALLSMSTEPA